MASSSATAVAPVTQNASIAHLATDPLRNFKFVVSISPNTGAAAPSMGFMTVEGLSTTIDVIAYREGGFNTTTQKMPGQADFAPITLSKGVILGNTYGYDWVSQLFTVMQGTGNQGAGQDFRANVNIQVLDHPVTQSSVPVKAWFTVFNCWPTSISFANLDASANAMFVEQLSLAHEGWDYTLASNIGATNAATPLS